MTNRAEQITINQAADRIGVSRDTIRRRIADGSLPAIRLGPRMIRLNPADVDALLRPVAVTVTRSWE